MGQSNSIQELEQLKTENHRLRIAVEELSVLNDIATAISSTLELDRVVVMIVQKCVKHLKGEQGAIWLLEEQDQEKPWVTVVRTQDSELDGLPYRLDTQLTGWMIIQRLGTSPWMTLLFFFLGTASGFISLLRGLNKHKDV